MNQRSAVLFYSAVMTGIAAGFIYANRWKRESAALLHDIRDSAHRSANSSQALPPPQEAAARSGCPQRLHPACSKRGGKTRIVSSTESTAGSPRSGRFKTYSLWNSRVRIAPPAT